MPTVRLRVAARRDLLEHFVYLAENAGLTIAERFLSNADASFEALAAEPSIASPLAVRHPALAGMRKWRVKDFDNHLIFFLPQSEGVSIVRVLHAARDWWTVLGIDGR